MTDEELNRYIEREYKADRPVAAGALLMMHCLGLPDLVTKHQGETMRECFIAGAYYALALLRGAAKASRTPLPPELAGLFEQLYNEAQERNVMCGIDIEGQFDATKH